MNDKIKFKRTIPNALTMGNLFSGFMAINATINGDVKSAAIFIFIAIMLDAMDGRAARVLGVSGEFGKQLDSLADIVSFGVAPAFMAAYIYFDGTTIGILFAGLFPLFGAYRLARFNLTPQEESAKFFRGIPITLAGAVVSFLCLFERIIPVEVFTILFLALAVLMVSAIKIPSFKKLDLPRNAVITTIFVFYMIYLFIGVRPESVPVSFYMVVIVYIGFIVIRFFKEKEPRFKFKRYRYRGKIRFNPKKQNRFKKKMPIKKNKVEK